MSTPGLSLVGFMDQQQAILHLTTACYPQDLDPAVLTAEWILAQQRLGPPVHNAGNPRIEAIDPAYSVYLQHLEAQPVFQPGGVLHGSTFQLVEIEPLLAFQFFIDEDRSTSHCNRLTKPPTSDELIELCLPLAPPTENIQPTPGPTSILLRARSLNLHIFGGGLITHPDLGQFLGVHFGLRLPYVQVVRHNGRCYLHNGFHRVFGARKAGADRIPCVFRDVSDHAAVGIRDGQTFSAPLLEGPNPPTLAHYTQGRAHPVAIRAHSRVLHVSWAEYVVADE